MQKIFITAISCGLLVTSDLMASQKQPNIIMFLVDDMGWQDTSVPFYNNEQTPLNKRFNTPNMYFFAYKMQPDVGDECFKTSCNKLDLGTEPKNGQ